MSIYKSTTNMPISTTTNDNMFITNAYPSSYSISDNFSRKLIFSGDIDIRGSSNIMHSDFIQYLTEDELTNLMDIVSSRGTKAEAYKFFSELIQMKHFSEDYLMKYLYLVADYDKASFVDKLNVLYESDIKSGQYAQIALWEQLNV